MTLKTRVSNAWALAPMYDFKILKSLLKCWSGCRKYFAKGIDGSLYTSLVPAWHPHFRVYHDKKESILYIPG